MGKKITLLVLILSYAQFVSAQQATDFTATDCSGNQHNLFSELDAGKVVVLNWVMPCTTCIPASVSTYNISQSYTNSHPGRVSYYLIDDNGGTICATLITWASNNFIEPDVVFSNAGNVIDQANYGGSGMPHIVIIGPDHNIYFNGLDLAADDSVGIINAINQALNAVGINERTINEFQLSVEVKPGTAIVNFSLSKSSEVMLEIFDAAGHLEAMRECGKLQQGAHKIFFPFKPAKGIFLVRLKAEKKMQTIKFDISSTY
jgi:hypothetical protein